MKINIMLLSGFIEVVLFKACINIKTALFSNK